MLFSIRHESVPRNTPSNAAYTGAVQGERLGRKMVIIARMKPPIPAAGKTTGWSWPFDRRRPGVDRRRRQDRQQREGLADRPLNGHRRAAIGPVDLLVAGEHFVG